MNLSSFSDLDAIHAALDVAKVAGVKLLIGGRELAKEPEATARRFRAHPALGGYYLQDEPNAGDFARLSKWAARIRSVDDAHVVYVNLFPNYATSEQLGAKDYPEYVKRFVEQAPVQMLSFDFYPVINDAVRTDWYQNLQTIADAASGAGKPFWAFALSVRHYGYPTATLPHLREQVYSDLAYGAQCIQYFTYWTGGDPIFADAPIDRSGRRTAVYDRVKRVNEEIRARSAVFIGSKVLSIGHTGSHLPAGTTAFIPSFPVKNLATEGTGALVSLLANGKDRYLVVVNRDIKQAMPVAISFDAAVVIARVEKNGVLTKLSDPELHASIEPGDVLICTWETKE